VGRQPARIEVIRALYGWLREERRVLEGSTPALVDRDRIDALRAELNGDPPSFAPSRVPSSRVRAPRGRQSDESSDLRDLAGLDHRSAARDHGADVHHL
jgi:hypothetical protein